MNPSQLTGALMVQGCTSDAGKTTLVTALCRILYRQGISVAPFKPQNMALNSAVTADGGEIGRAQALQAQACGLEPSTLFNPVLLKPSSDQRSQVIINGQAVSELESRRFGSIKELAFEPMMEAYHTLRKRFDVVLIEGAGSPAEINLRKNDIANMGFAEAADTPVVLVGDIDKGGVFAHLIGTQMLLSKSEQARIKGFVINRFRGSLALLQDGLDWLESYSRKPVLGVLPYLSGLKLDAEDAIATRYSPPEFAAPAGPALRIKVPVLSRISNHTDFDPLLHHPRVAFEFVGPGDSLQGADLIILPGSKNVRQEMTLIKQQRWDADILRHLRLGGKVLGICGGFQLLGKSIHDPEGIEDKPGTCIALGLLDFETRLQAKKQLKQVTGCFSFARPPSDKEAPPLTAGLQGYEIHCGMSSGPALAHPFAELQDQNGYRYKDGAHSTDGQVIGTYVHGLFESGACLDRLITWACSTLGQAGDAASEPASSTNWWQIREQEINRIADHFERALTMRELERIIRNT